MFSVTKNILPERIQFYLEAIRILHPVSI